MPNYATPYVEWTDAVGLVRLTLFVPRLTGFTPDVDPKGPRHAALGDGTTYQFVFRTDYVAKLTLPNFPAWQMPDLLRLKAWLLSGGSVTLYTADQAARTYTVKLREGTVPEVRFNPDDMEYALDLEVMNVAAAPLTVVYEGPGILVDVNYDYAGAGATFSRSGSSSTYYAGP